MHAIIFLQQHTIFSGFSTYVISQAHISFRFAVLMADCGGTRHVFILNYSVIQGSLNNQCSNTLET